MIVLAKTGERVMDAETGKIICRVKSDLYRYSYCSADDFHEFADDEKPWLACDEMDKRCTRPREGGGMMLFVEGEWR